MTQVAQHYTEKVIAPKKANFTVVHRSPSGFSKDGGKTRIDTAQFKRILNDDRCMLTKDNVQYFNEVWGSEYLTINENNEVFAPNKNYIGILGTIAHKRYIKGQNVIWKTEQEKLGIHRTPHSNDEIIMEWGEYNVDSGNKPTDKGLLVFLLTHNQNDDNPYRDKSIAMPSFKIQDARRNASIDLDKQDKVQEATDLIYEIRDKKNKSFDKDKLAFYTNVFRTQISGYDSEEEKFRALLTIAQTNPDVIINGVQKESVNYLQVVQQAIALDIIARERGKYLNVQTGTTIITFRAGISEELCIEKMVNYYSSNDGQAEFQHLKNSVEAVKNSRMK